MDHHIPCKLFSWNSPIIHADSVDLGFHGFRDNAFPIDLVFALDEGLSYVWINFSIMFYATQLYRYSER